MKVLHVFDTVGVASILCKYLRKMFDVDTKIITREVLDKWGIVKFYGEAERLSCGPWYFGLKCLREAGKYDLIHIHGWEKIVSFIRALWHKPLILHYHGTDIRGKWNLKSKRTLMRSADKILYCSRDLESRYMPEKAMCIPNPVDVDYFRNFDGRFKQSNSALTMSYYADDEASKLAWEHDLNLTIVPRHVPYPEMPKLLSQFEYYVEVKRDICHNEVLGRSDDLSCVALQALACGLKVVRWDGEIIETLPEEHEPEHVAATIYALYEGLLG